MSIDMNAIHPRLASALQKLQSQCAAKGLALGFSTGYRSKAEQDALYAQGRSTAGSIVTNARGGYSQHNWGIAADFFQNIKGREWEASFFNTVGPMAEVLGLGWGGRWTDFVDRPHLYLPDWGDTPTPLINKYGLNGFASFKATWSGSSSGSSSSGSSSGTTTTNWQDKLNYPLLHSDATKRAQIHLNNYVNWKLDVDGYLGKKTLQAMIAAIQYALNADYKAGLTVDGLYGSKTEAALKSRILEMGSSGELVRALQIDLLARGDDPIQIDGSFGKNTKTAVETFQRDTGLTKDGVAGIKTFSSLIFKS